VTGPGHPVLHVPELVRRLEQGDPAVRAAALAAGEHLGLLLHNLIVTIDPALVVIGGPLSRLGELIEVARVSLARLSGTSTSHQPEVRVCRFGPSAGAIGAAGHVLQQLLNPLDRRLRAAQAR
jgi:predicted NBD/HSP70 family sugar kinase